MHAKSPCTWTDSPTGSASPARLSSTTPGTTSTDSPSAHRLGLDQGLLDRRHRLARLAASLEALSPLAVLGRGYSLTFRFDDKSLIRSADDVQPGQRILTRLANGQIVGRVEPDPASPSLAPKI